MTADSPAIGKLAIEYRDSWVVEYHLSSPTNIELYNAALGLGALSVAPKSLV